MQFNIIKKISFSLLLALFAFSWTGCELDEIPDPNGADADAITEDASLGQLQNVVTGIESLLRKEVGFYYDVTSIIGREYYFFTGSEPRYTGEVLGKGDAVLDNAGFYGTRPYSGRYRTIKNCNILIEAANNSSSINDAQRKGYLGFAKTMQAYELHLVANLQYDNGIRLDVADPDNLGAFTADNAASLAGIAALLEEAAADLAGAEFNFVLSSGFDGFNTPATFLQFNRALAARIALYRGENGDALRFLGESFYDLDADFNLGPKRPYSEAGGELVNNIFRAPNQSDGIIAHPETAALLVDDARGSKIQEREAVLALDGLSGNYDVLVFDSRNASIPLITNEELILIAAEANIGVDEEAGLQALNTIRSAYGLDDVDDLSIDEVLMQRRLSLFGLGHRWVDLRRLGRLGDLPIDRDGDDVWVQFPRPVTEV